MLGPYLFLLVSIYLLITLAIMAVGCVAALALGFRDRLVLVMAGLVSLGVLGFATFWTYLANNRVGQWFAILAVIGCAAIVLRSAVRGVLRSSLPTLKPLFPITAFVAANAYFMIALGYLRGEFLPKAILGRNRYVPGLSTDNSLPLYLAQQLQSPVRPLPAQLAGPWQASDRPPLQTGVYLLEHGLIRSDSFVHYQVIGTIAQCLWPFGVWAFMVSAKMPSRAVSLAVAVTGFSGFTIANSFFVWPKLFPAAYLMVAAAALFGSSLELFRRDWIAGTLLGLCLGSAMLCHPGSLFSVIGFCIALLMLRMWPTRILLGSVAAGIGFMYVPWVWFQRVYDPPGDYLMKWQLAGLVRPDKRTLWQALHDQYAAVGWSGAIANKWYNFTAPFKDTLRYPQMVFEAVRYRLSGNQARLSAALGHAQVSTFLRLPSAVGLMAVGTPLLAAAIIWRRWIGRAGAPAPYLRTGALSLVCLTVVYVAWALVMFGPAGAPTNVAMSYITQLLMFCLGVMGWWAVSPRAAAIAVAVQSVVALWMFAIAPPYLGRGARPVPIHASMASLAIVAFAALVVCLWLLDRQSPYSIGGASGRAPEGLAPRPVTGGVSAHSMPAFRSSSRRRVGGGPLRRRLARHSHSRRSRTAEDEVAVCAGTVEAPPQDESRPAAEPAVRDAAPLRSPGLP